MLTRPSSLPDAARGRRRPPCPPPPRPRGVGGAGGNRFPPATSGGECWNLEERSLVPGVLPPGFEKYLSFLSREAIVAGPGDLVENLVDTFISPRAFHVILVVGHLVYFFPVARVRVVFPGPSFFPGLAVDGGG